MQSEVITRRDDLMIRRLVLEPGEAMPWHTDACHRFSVIVRGQQLTLEFRETGEQMEVAVYPGMVDWDQPDARVHRAVNTGATTSRRSGHLLAQRATARTPTNVSLSRVAAGVTPRPSNGAKALMLCVPSGARSGGRCADHQQCYSGGESLSLL